MTVTVMRLRVAAAILLLSLSAPAWAGDIHTGSASASGTLVHTHADAASGGTLSTHLVKSGTYAANEMLCAVDTTALGKACLAGATLTSTGLDLPAHSTDGSCIGFKEGADDGANTLSLCAPNTGFTATTSVTAFGADGLIVPAALGTATKTRTLCSTGIAIATSVVSVDLGEVIDAGTARAISCLTRGTITTAPQFHLTECATDGSACTNMTTAAITCGNTKATSSTFGGAAGASIAAGAVLQATSANTPSVAAGALMFCVHWTPN